MSKKIYIFTPANICSGGPEALHQLSYYMRLCGLNSYIVYYSDFFIDAQPQKRYMQYEPHVVSFSDIDDSPSNICIAPENAPWCLNNIRYAKRCIMWLGVGANKVLYPTFLQRIVYAKRRLFNQSLMAARFLLYDDRKCLHLCGSKYAYEYVSKKYPSSDIRYLVEPISKDFYEIGNIKINRYRKNIVLYNPSKPSERMSQLLMRANFEYIPLQGFTPVELAQKYSEAKLYIDLGRFDGPERIPKEAVYFGCNILVANHNAAANDFDVAIPQRYKIDDNETVEQIEERIRMMLNDYDQHLDSYNPFRMKIKHLEETYVNQIKEIFNNAR